MHKDYAKVKKTFNPGKDKYGRPLYDLCRDCAKPYRLDFSAWDRTGDDQLGPVRDYCGRCNSAGNSHYYPFI